MVSKKRIRSYFAKRWKKLFKNFRAINQSPDPDGVHDLRLESKKLKAVAVLLNQTNGVCGHLSIKPMKPLIQRTGTIREAELHLKNFRVFELEKNGMGQEQKDIVENGYAGLHRYKKNYKTGIKTTEKKFLKAARRINNKKIKNYVTLIVRQLVVYFLWPLDKSQLHESRKKIKNLVYAIRLLPQKLQRKIHIDVNYLDQLQELIGQWHDLHLTGNLLLHKQQKETPAYDQIQEKEASLFEQVKKQAEYFDRKVMVS